MFHRLLISNFRKLGTSIKGYLANMAVSLEVAYVEHLEILIFAFCFDGIKYPGICLLLARYLLDHGHIRIK